MPVNITMCTTSYVSSLMGMSPYNTQLISRRDAASVWLLHLHISGRIRRHVSAKQIAVLYHCHVLQQQIRISPTVPERTHPIAFIDTKKIPSLYITYSCLNLSVCRKLHIKGTTRISWLFPENVIINTLLQLLCTRIRSLQFNAV